MKITKQILKDTLEVYCKTDKSESLEEATKHFWKLLKHYKKAVRCDRVVLNNDLDTSAKSIKETELIERLKTEEIYGYFTDSLRDIDILTSQSNHDIPISSHFGKLLAITKDGRYNAKFESLDLHNVMAFKYFIETEHTVRSTVVHN